MSEIMAMERQPLLDKVRLAKIITAAAGLAMVAAGCSSGGQNKETQETQAPATVTQPMPTSEAPSVGVVPAENCEHSKNNRLPAIGPNVVVDGTCYDEPSAPTFVYAQPKQIKGTDIGSLENGAPVTMLCTIEGEPIQDDAATGAPDNSVNDPHDSNIWVKIKADGLPKEGYIPEVWVGYPKQGLVKDC